MIFGKIVDGITTLGKDWLGNKKTIAKARADLKVAELNARRDLASDAFKLELKQLEETGALDRIAVKKQTQTLWDEILACVIMTPLALSIYGACAGASPEMWGYLIIQTLHYLPTWYLWGLGLLFVNYFGFRSLLRVFLKMSADKASNLKSLFVEKDDDKDKTKTP